MLSIILTAVMLVTLLSCNKEYQKSDNGNVTTIEKLNQGKYDSIISELGSDSNLSSDKRYYLASAYSQAGNVDVYSLYPVMEIQLFHKNALEWSDLSKEKNPYLKFMKGQEGVDQNMRSTKLQKTWEKYEARLKHRMRIGEKASLEEVHKYDSSISQETYDRIDSDLSKKYEEVIKSDLDRVEDDQEKVTESDLENENSMKDKIEVFWNYAVQYPDSSSNENFIAQIIGKYYKDLLTLAEIKENFIHPEKKRDQFSTVKWEMVYMNVLWNTYEAIPVMKKLPSLSLEQQDNITKALDLYSSLLDSPRYKEVAIKNILVLGSVSLLSIYKDSFDLESVTSIQDLLCWFEPEVLLDNYSLVRKRLFFLQESLEKSSYRPEDYDSYKNNLEEYKKVIQEDLTEIQRERYIESIDDFKINSCIKG